MILHGFLPYFLLGLSLSLLIMGLHVSIKKIPLIFNMKWITVLMTLTFMPTIVKSFLRFLDAPSFISILLILLFTAILGFYFFMFKGFQIIGVDGQDFQRALLECINDRKYEYEQSISTIKIKNPETELQIAIHSWIGTAQIRCKNKGQFTVLADLIEDLKAKEIKSNNIFPIFYIIFGTIMTISTILLIINR